MTGLEASITCLLKQIIEAQEKMQKQLVNLQQWMISLITSLSKSTKQVVQKLEQDKFVCREKETRDDLSSTRS